MKRQKLPKDGPIPLARRYIEIDTGVSKAFAVSGTEEDGYVVSLLERRLQMLREKEDSSVLVVKPQIQEHHIHT